MSPPRRKPIISSIVLQSVAIGIMILIAIQIWRRGEPERLTNLRDSPLNFHIVNSVLYRPAYRDPWNLRAPVIVSRPINGRERVILEENQQFQFMSPRTFTVDDAGIIYGLSRYRPLDPSVPRLMMAPALGGILPPQKPAGLVRPMSKQSNVSAPAPRFCRLRQVPLVGGPARDLATIQSGNVALADKTAFWVRPSARPNLNAQRGTRNLGPPERLGDLMLTSLVDGRERQVRSGIPVETQLMTGTDGVFWIEFTNRPNSGGDLFYARSADGRARRVGSAARDDLVRWAVEYRGRVFWLQGPAAFNEDGTDAGVIMSADLAGADTRRVCTLSGLQRLHVPGSGAAVYRGSLYLVLTDMSGPLTEESQRQNCLCRLHPGAKDPIEVVRKLSPLSGLFQFDHGCLYYVSKEKDVGPIGALLDDAPGPLSNVLYRVALEP